MRQPDSRVVPTRRALLRTGFVAGLSASAVFANPLAAFAAAPLGFEQWRDRFRAHALSKGISEATWARVMGRIEPDMSVFRELGNQPEFNEELWQYINRRVSDWRIINGRAALRKNEALFARIEPDFGVERGTTPGLWAGHTRRCIRQAGRCARFHRALSRQPRQISSRRTLGL